MRVPLINARSKLADLMTLLRYGVSAVALSFAPSVLAQQDAAVEVTPFVWSEVGFTEDCGPNPAFSRLLGIFARNPAPANVEPVFDQGLYQAVQGDTKQDLILDSAQDWNGLKLTGMSLYSGIERGPVNYYLYFEEEPETVRAVWNKRGWKIPATGEQEVIDGYAYIGVQAREGGGSLVACWRD